jgi:hypothetical protein
MAATYVTQSELRTNLGIGQLYSDSIVEECCQTAEDLLNQFLWFDSYPVVGAALYNNVGMVLISAPVSFVTGQTITLSGCGSTYNGSRTITGTYPYTNGSVTLPYFINFPFNYYQFPRGYSLIQFALIAANDNYHQVVPYGKALGIDTKTASYATTPAVREAAMILAVQIWQSRQVPNGGGMDMSMGPAPFQIGNSLMARVRSLIAPYQSPRSMVG